MDLEALDIARWQFAITTVYHFLFVPITIGLSALVAGYQTAWLRTGNEQWLRMTKFLGKLFLINFALGVVVHLGTLFSAYFILAANSFMQNPVGYDYNAETGRAELTDFVAVLTNKVQLVTFPHVILAAYMTAGAFVAGVALWHLVRGRGQQGSEDRSMYRSGARVGAWVLLVAGLGVVVSGDVQGKVMTEVQPMKMAAAEALYETEEPAAFSVFTIGTPDGTTEKFSVTIPNLLSFLATGELDGRVEGINPLREQYIETYGQDPGATYYTAGDYTPYIPLTYWSFRFMMGLGFAGMAGGLAVLWATRRGRAPTGARWTWVAVGLPLMPLFANSFGWIFTEIGRQPWVVFGLMTTEQGVSPGTTTGEVLTSLVVLTALYGVLAAVELKLMLTYIAKGADPYVEPQLRDDDNDPDRPLAFAY